MDDSSFKTILRTNNVNKTYKIIAEVGSGTYGRVYKAKCLKTNQYVALKKIEMHKQFNEGFPITAIREIRLLQMLSHPNIISLKEIIMTKPSVNNKYMGSTYLVFEYMEHDIVGLMYMKCKFQMPQIKCAMRQILDGVNYLNKKKILHRDLKSANILFNNQGEIKIADFGLARILSNNPDVQYTNRVVTLWYRAPELLLGARDYNSQIDVWSIGCIFAELLTGDILFKGDKESKQIELIYELCGSVDKKLWPEVEKFSLWKELQPKQTYPRSLKEHIFDKMKNSQVLKTTQMDFEALDLLDGLLTYDPKKRLTCEQALNHVFFQNEPLACSVDKMPRYEKEYHETLIRMQQKEGIDIKQIEREKEEKFQQSLYNTKQNGNKQNLDKNNSNQSQNTNRPYHKQQPKSNFSNKSQYIQNNSRVQNFANPQSNNSYNNTIINNSNNNISNSNNNNLNTINNVNNNDQNQSQQQFQLQSLLNQQKEFRETPKEKLKQTEILQKENDQSESADGGLSMLIKKKEEPSSKKDEQQSDSFLDKLLFKQLNQDDKKLDKRKNVIKKEDLQKKIHKE